MSQNHLDIKQRLTEKLFNFRYFCSAKLMLAAAIVVVMVLALIMILPRRGESYRQTHDEIIALAGKVRNHYKIRPDYWGLSNESALKNKIIPETMIRGGKIISSLGKEIVLGQDEQGIMVMPGSRNFSISINNLSKKACIEMLSQPFTDEELLGLTAISLTAADKIYLFEWGTDFNAEQNVETASQNCLNHNSIRWIFE